MKDLSIMIDDIKFNFRAALLIENEDEILIQRDPNYDFTTLPGGRVKALESSIDALIREINEEMGVTLNKEEVKLKALIENFFEFESKKYHELYFLYKIKSNDKRFPNNMRNKDSQSSYYCWVKKDALDKENLLPAVLRKTILNDNFESIVNNDLK